MSIKKTRQKEILKMKHSNLKWASIIFFISLIYASTSLSIQAQEKVTASVDGSKLIDALKPGNWLQVKGSALKSVAPTDGGNVMDPWSGGAFDTKRDQLIIWGGGHGDYSGNEIYTFSLKTFTWTRVNNPSNPPAKDVAYATDGGPCSRHTYNYIQYVPSIDRFVTLGGAGFYQSGQTGTNEVDAFDFETKKWSKLASMPQKTFGIGAFSAVDSSTGYVWQHGAGGKMLNIAHYVPSTNTWVSHNGIWDEGENDFSYYLTAAVDTKRKLFVACGRGDLWSWNTAEAGKLVGKKIETTGDIEIIKKASPGFEYHPKSDRFIAWSGGADVYTLNMDTKVWTKVQPATENTVIPTAAASNGTFGRFRYSPNKDVFVVVNKTTEDVYIYRLPSAPSKP